MVRLTKGDVRVSPSISNEHCHRQEVEIQCAYCMYVSGGDGRGVKNSTNGPLL